MPSFAMPVRLYMSSPVLSVLPDASLHEIHDELRDRRVSSLAVVDGDRTLLGVVTRTDLLRIGRLQAGARPKAALLTLPDKTAAQIMTSPAVTVEPEAPVEVAAALMVKERVHRVFVEDSGNPVGVLGTRDVMAAIRDKRVNEPIEAYKTSPVFTIRYDEPIRVATDRLDKAGVSGLVVVEGDWPVGIFTQEEALAGRHLEADTPVEEAMSHALLCLSAGTKLHRAAARAEELNVRRIVVMEEAEITGILSGLDLARVATGS